MASAKGFRRQAATCATLAAETHDEEGRQRYLRLEQIYLHLAESEEAPRGNAASAYAGDNGPEPTAFRAN